MWTHECLLVPYAEGAWKTSVPVVEYVYVGSEKGSAISGPASAFLPIS